MSSFSLSFILLFATIIIFFILFHALNKGTRRRRRKTEQLQCSRRTLFLDWEIIIFQGGRAEVVPLPWRRAHVKRGDPAVPRAVVVLMINFTKEESTPAFTVRTNRVT